jgi:hypothetical protein
MKTDERKIYYVYEYYNTVTDYIFYVGKGSGTRIYEQDKGARNKLFLEYIKYNKFKYRKIYENINEETALTLESNRILELKSKGMCSCNCDNGGKIGGRSYGTENGFYGKKHSNQTVEYLRRINSDGRNKGKNNSQYGVHLKDRMSESVYNIWIKKLKEANSGEKNAQYGIKPKDRMSPEKYKIWLTTQNKGNGSKNPNAKPITMFNENISINFGSIIECSQYLILNKYTNSKLQNIQKSISVSIHKQKTYLKFNFKYIDQTR